MPNSINSKQVSGHFDGILAHFSTAGVMGANSAKFTGGNTSNYAVKTSWGKVYTVGEANSSMTPTNSGLYYYNSTPAGNSDGCFSIHSQNLATTIHNSFLGGNGDDAAYDIQFTHNGLFYICGGTNSSNFPTYSVTGMYNNAGNPNNGVWLNDNFISCFQEGNTNLTWSTYLGSEYNESLYFPESINTQAYKAVTAMAVSYYNYLYVLGETNSYTTFPKDEWTGAPTYFQPAKDGMTLTSDATITRFNVAVMNTIVGIKDFENTQFVFGIYPNPASSSISITDAAITGDDLHYAIYDLEGKKIKEGVLRAADAKNVNISSLQQGVYILNVSNGKTTFSNKFIKSND